MQQERTYQKYFRFIQNADSLCDDKEECANIRDIYNVTNKLLSWQKTQVNDRQIRFDFT